MKKVFIEVRSIAIVQENLSKINTFFELTTSRDFWKLARPWNVEYSRAIIMKHLLEYDENVTLLAFGVPLGDGRFVVLYEFSKPIQGVKTVAYEFTVNNSKVKITRFGINGNFKTLSSCTYECQKNEDCPPLTYCSEYCCSVSTTCVIRCCATPGNGACSIPCMLGPGPCILCALVACPFCGESCCTEKGSKCESIFPEPKP